MKKEVSVVSRFVPTPELVVLGVVVIVRQPTALGRDG